MFKRFYSVFKNSFANMENLVAVCQLTATNNKEVNYYVCEKLIRDAENAGAKMIFLPEAFDYIESDRTKALDLAESINGPLIEKYKMLASSLKVWLSLGGFHEEFSETKLKNTHIVINHRGKIVATYHKLHLYDVDIPSENIQTLESSIIEPGNEIIPPVQTPIGNVGLGICYDVRFSQMALMLTENGAQILTYPSAFFFGTGAHHWELLLRSRAIETQCYVIAAAQFGSHNATRKSWGHSMVVDPLGTIIAQCSDKPGFILAQIDLSLVTRVRQSMPIENHKRYDVYSKMLFPISCNEIIQDSLEFPFGSSIVKGLQIFYKTRLSFAFTNIKCVLPGHVLVAPNRVVAKMTELSSDEVQDLFLAVQKVQKVIEKVHVTNSSTIVIQDGQDAGQTIKHVHVHIIPRKVGDLLVNDDIYRRLQNEKNCTNSRRSDVEMKHETMMLRSYFK